MRRRMRCIKCRPRGKTTLFCLSNGIDVTDGQGGYPQVFVTNKQKRRQTEDKKGTKGREGGRETGRQ